MLYFSLLPLSSRDTQHYIEKYVHFCPLFQGNWKEAKEKVVVMEETAACQQHFPKFLKSFYTHEILLDEENVIPIMMLADKYIVPAIIDVCTEYMIANLNVYNAIHWHKFAMDFSQPKLLTGIVDHMKLNFSALKKKLIHLEKDNLCEILSSDKLVLQSEGDVLECVIDWMQAFDREFSWEDGGMDNATELLMCVRFMFLQPHEILLLESHKVLASVQEKCLSSAINNAYRFHSGAFSKKFDEDLKDREDWLRSRVYTGQKEAGFSSIRVGKLGLHVKEYMHMGNLSCPTSFSMALRNSIINWSVSVSTIWNNGKCSLEIHISPPTQIKHSNFAVLVVSKLICVGKIISDPTEDAHPIGLGYHKYLTLRKGGRPVISQISLCPYNDLPNISPEKPLVFDISIFPLL